MKFQHCVLLIISPKDGNFLAHQSFRVGNTDKTGDYSLDVLTNWELELIQLFDVSWCIDCNEILFPILDVDDHCKPLCICPLFEFVLKCEKNENTKNAICNVHRYISFPKCKIQIFAYAFLQPNQFLKSRARKVLLFL